MTEKRKRFSDLLRATVLLPDYTLVLARRGPDRDAPEALASRLGVAEPVRFADFMSDRAELRHFHRDCGVFVSSSAWETMALVLLEEMSCAARRTVEAHCGSEVVHDRVRALVEEAASNATVLA